MKSIDTKAKLMKELNIKNLNELNDINNQKKFIDFIKDNEISPIVFKDILTTVPLLTETFNEMFKTMDNIGTSIEETKRLRWEIIKELAIKDKLSSEQILEAMKLLKEIEKNESIDWTKIFAGIGGVLIMGIGTFLKMRK